MSETYTTAMFLFAALTLCVLIFAGLILKSIYRLFVPGPPLTPAQIQKKRREARLVTLITVVLVFGSLAITTRFNSAKTEQQNSARAEAEQLEREQTQRATFNRFVKKRKLAIGMTENDVIAAWGEPLRKEISVTVPGGGVQMFYSSNRLVVLQRDKVISFHADEK